MQVFSNDPQNWRRASPMRYVKNMRNPQLFLVGGNTYPSIQKQDRRLFSIPRDPGLESCRHGRLHVRRRKWSIRSDSRFYATLLTSER